MKTRREFIGCGTCALLLLGCGEKSTTTDTGVAQPTPTPEPESLPASFDPCETTPSSGWTELRLEDYPNLVEVGGSITWNGIVIAHVEEGCYAAVDASCTHQGGQIYYSSQRRQFSCVEHAATFELDGEWALGTATTDLNSYLVAREGEILFIEA